MATPPNATDSAFYNDMVNIIMTDKSLSTEQKEQRINEVESKMNIDDAKKQAPPSLMSLSGAPVDPNPQPQPPPPVDWGKLPAPSGFGNGPVIAPQKPPTPLVNGAAPQPPQSPPLQGPPPSLSNAVAGIAGGADAKPQAEFRVISPDGEVFTAPNEELRDKALANGFKLADVGPPTKQGTVPGQPAAPKAPASGTGGAYVNPAGMSFMDSKNPYGFSEPMKAEYGKKLKAEDDKKAGIQAMADAEVGQSEATANTLLGAKEKLAALRSEEDEKESARQLSLRNDLDTLQKDATTFGQTKVDPNRYWHNKTTDQKVLAGIGLVLGAMGSGLTGRENMVLRKVEGDMDRDIMAQRIDLQTKGQSIDARRGLYGQKLAMYNDERMAFAATKMDYLTGMKLEMDAQAAKFTGDKAKASAQVAISEIDRMIAEQNMSFQKAAEDKAQATAAAAAAARTAELKHQRERYEKHEDMLLQGKIDMSKDSNKAEAEAAAKNKGGAMEVPLYGTDKSGIPQQAGTLMAKSTDAAKSLSEASAAWNRGKAAVADARKYLEAGRKSPWYSTGATTINPWSDQTKKAEEIETNLLLGKQGALNANGAKIGSSENDVEIIKKTIPNLDGMSTDAAEQLLNDYDRSLDNDYKTSVQMYAVPPPQKPKE